MSLSQIRVSVIGARALTAFHLVRLLQQHPQVQISYLYGREGGQEEPYENVYPFFEGEGLFLRPLNFDQLVESTDLVFLTLPHTQSMQMMNRLAQTSLNIIDLSADFRLQSAEDYFQAYGVKHQSFQYVKQFVYGLSEYYKNHLSKAQYVANPGCFPTSVLLALIPLLSLEGLCFEGVVIDSKTGISGAGRKPSEKTSFIQRSESVQAYKVGFHQHRYEIASILKDNALSNQSIEFTFVPHLVPISCGILSTIYIPLSQPSLSLETVYRQYQTVYQSEPFVRIKQGGQPVDPSFVRGTHFCDISFVKTSQHLIVTSAIDNLMKGASSQAIHNMNIMYGLSEKMGICS